MREGWRYGGSEEVREGVRKGGSEGDREGENKKRKGKTDREIGDRWLTSERQGVNQ